MSRGRRMKHGLAALVFLLLLAIPAVHAYAPPAAPGPWGKGGGAEPDVAFLMPGEADADLQQDNGLRSGHEIVPGSHGPGVPPAVGSHGASDRANGVKNGQRKVAAAASSAQARVASCLGSRAGWQLVLLFLPR